MSASTKLYAELTAAERDELMPAPIQPEFSKKHVDEMTVRELEQFERAHGITRPISEQIARRQAEQ